jgi:hypothetical protein
MLTGDASRLKVLRLLEARLLSTNQIKSVLNAISVWWYSYTRKDISYITNEGQGYKLLQVISKFSLQFFPHFLKP